MTICIMTVKPPVERCRLSDFNIPVCDGQVRHRRNPKAKCQMADGVISETGEKINESKAALVKKEQKELARKCNECGPPSPRGERESAYYCAKDMVVQIGTCLSLTQTGWYFENFTSQEAKQLLRKEPVGTFLIRDSSDAKYLYSLSVKTIRGTTSVRIVYNKGHFLLDSDERVSSKMPKFDSAVRLVDFYARLTDMGKSYVCRWLESTGRKDLPIVLQKPKRNCVTDLKHLCRLSINQSLPKTLSRTKVLSYMDKLPLPPPITEYLKDYPYIH